MTVAPAPTPTPTPTPTAASPKPGVGGALTRKLGPLPVWAWAVVIGGAGLGWRLMRGGGASQTTVQQIPTTYLPDSTQSGFLNELSVALNDIRDRLAGTTPGSPLPATFANIKEWLTSWESKQTTLAPLPTLKPGDDLGMLIVRMRRALGLDPSKPSGPLPPGGNTAGETPEQRNARLLAEYQRLHDALVSMYPGQWPFPISAKPPTTP